MTSTSARTTRTAVLAWILPLAVGLLCMASGTVVPLASPLLVALVVGGLVGNSPLLDARQRLRQAAVAKTLLRWGVVLLGLRLPLDAVIEIGLPGLVIIASTVAVTFVLTCMLGDRLGLDRGLVTLIASGFSVCGAAAIAAVEGGIKRKEEDVALAVAMVTIFGTLMIVLQPLVGAWLGLTDRQRGVWAGASIHEVAQVVAAAATAGAVGVAVATTVKLGRVATLAVVFVAAQRRDRRGDPDRPASSGRRIPTIPWFVTGFLLAAALRSTGVVPSDVLRGLDVATTVLLAAGMFGLGLGIHLASLLPIPPRVLLLSAGSTVVAAGFSGALVLALF